MDELKHAALAAYERGRWWWAARVAWVIVPLVALSLIGATLPWLNVVAGTSLLALAVWMRWLGGDWSAAVELGLGAGAVAYVAPLAVPMCTNCCTTGGACGIDMGPMIAAGVLAGGVIGARAGAARGAGFGLAASGLAGLLATLTCAPFGLALTLGMAAALVVSTGAVMVVARATT